MRPAVFFDRDDTLIRNSTLPPPASPHPNWKPGDLSDPARVELLPGALRACRLLHGAGYALVVVSNQGCVARGSATIADVEAVNARVGELLTDERGQPMIERFAYCPFHPLGAVPRFTREHRLRKPSPGMILDAADDLGLDLSRSWLVGDMKRDIEAGINAGLSPERCLLIGEPGGPADALAAAEFIIAAPG